MKILRLRLSILILVSFCLLCLPNKSPIFEYKNNFDITYYYYVYASDLKLKNATVTNCGVQCIVECNSKYAKTTKDQLGQILGESIRIKKCNKSSINKILNDYKDIIKYEESIDDYRLIYCYDKRLSNNVLLNNQKINIQIAIKDDEVNIGYPLILNGF